MGLVEAGLLHPGAVVVPQVGQRGEFGVLGDPFVGGLGEHALLHGVDLDGELQRFLVAVVLVAGVGVGGFEFEFVTGGGPDELFVDLRDAGGP